MSISIRKILTGAAVWLTALVLMSGTAFADGVILAPGVELSGTQKNEAAGPGGPGSAAGTEASGDTASSGAASGAADGAAAGNAAGPGGPGSAAGTEASGETPGSAAAESDIESLTAASIADPYTLFPTQEEGIFMSRGRKIDAFRPMLALTFDDGPREDTGSRIMDVFEKYGQRATFYIVGNRVGSRASELKRMAAAGHELGNHSFTHTYFNKLGAEGIQNEVRSCNDIIEQLTGIRPRTMRLPGGIKSSTILANVNMPVVLWNIDTRDWEHRNTARTVSSVIGKVSDGDIVLMHELYESTAAAAEQLVPQLVEQGFQLVTVSEMAALRGFTLTENTVYYSLKQS